MSEKRTRVGKYKKLHVDVNEFKKQTVVNEDTISRLNQIAQSVDVNKELEDVHIMDVDKKATTVSDMKTIEAFAQQANVKNEVDENTSRIKKNQAKIFIVEDNEEVKVDEVVIADKVEVQEVNQETTVEETTNDKILVDEILEEVVEPEVVEKGEVAIVEEKEVVASEPKEEIKKEKKKKNKKNRWHNIGLGFFTFCNICALICFFVAYGPFNQVRDLFVTTAMSTMTKKYLANVLYSTETIQGILAANVTIEPNEIMDANAISIGQIEEPTMYSSIYEEQVLKRAEGEELYKIVRIDENGYEGYAVFVYDPTKLKVATTKYLGSTGGEFVTDIAKREKAVIAINGGGFANSGTPQGYVYRDGKIVWSRNRGSKWGGGTIGFTKEGVMILTKSKGKAALNEGVYNGVDFGPFLIVNGKSAEVSGNGGWGIHPRTVIGQRQDGIVVILIIDGRTRASRGIDLNTAIDIMKRYDVYNAANLDGGSSTTLVVRNKIINNPVSTTASGQRYLPVAIVLKE